MPKIKHLQRNKANSLLLALLFLSPAGFAQSVREPASPGPVVTPHPKAEVVDQSGQAVDPGQGAAVLPESGAETAESVRQWLEKLASAVTNLEYRGLVAFEHHGMLETLEVVHGLRNGEQVERVRYLSGAPRELVSRGHSAHCRREGSPLSRAGLWTSMGQENVQSLYQFVLRGTERVADREAVVIEARPRDIHRLGMVISVDRETGLPLKSMLVSAGGQVLERYQFVKLSLEPVSDEVLQPQSAQVREADSTQGCGSTVSRWQLRWVPPGFKAVATRELADGEMLVYSDGLSVFTVFIQSLGADMNFNVRANRGATVAYMDQVEMEGRNYTVTVVGEIPENTAQILARAVSVK